MIVALGILIGIPWASSSLNERPFDNRRLAKFCLPAPLLQNGASPELSPSGRFILDTLP